jgi:Transglutaminase-like superfamily
VAPSQGLDWIQAYRPFFFENLAGITAVGHNRLLLCDRDRGLLTEVDLLTATETFSLRYEVDDFAEVSSLSYRDGVLYSTYRNQVYAAEFNFELDRLRNERLLTVERYGNLTGIAVTESTIYLTTDRQLILSYNRATQALDQLAQTPGVGADDLCYFNHQLFIVDAKEQTVYVFDLATQTFVEEILAPFENPTGITSVYHNKAGTDIFYLAYSRPSFEVFDTGDSEFKLELQTHVDRDRKQILTDNFVYPLLFQQNPKRHYVRSNGFLVEMYYVEKLHALPEVADEYKTVENLEWKISLPLNSDRQQVVNIETIGDFEMRIETIPAEANRQIAVFSIPRIRLATDRRVFGWKATVQVFGIRYLLPAGQTAEISETELAELKQYLQNEDQLDLDSRYVQRAAKDAIRPLKESERKDVLKKAAAIRDYIYDRLTYVMDSQHLGTEAVLRSGEGSCGEYLNVFSSLFRLNQIPTRKSGNYKVPAYKMQAGSRSVFLSPDFNHVWLQFYVPGLGWVPLESSADDGAASFRGWPKRYFMALAWYHLECRIGTYFEEVFPRNSDQPFFLSTSDLAKKDIKFRVVAELSPAES